jgi:hypothetical protein
VAGHHDRESSIVNVVCRTGGTPVHPTAHLGRGRCQATSRLTSSPKVKVAGSSPVAPTPTLTCGFATGIVIQR